MRKVHPFSSQKMCTQPGVAGGCKQKGKICCFLKIYRVHGSLNTWGCSTGVRNVKIKIWKWKSMGSLSRFKLLSPTSSNTDWNAVTDGEAIKHSIGPNDWMSCTVQTNSQLFRGACCFSKTTHTLQTTSICFHLRGRCLVCCYAGDWAFLRHRGTTGIQILRLGTNEYFHVLFKGNQFVP